MCFFTASATCHLSQKEQYNNIQLREHVASGVAQNGECPNLRIKSALSLSTVARCGASSNPWNSRQNSKSNELLTKKFAA